MFSDIAIPKNNEEEFIEMASKLGIKKLYFLYDFDKYRQESLQNKLNSIKNHKNIEVEIGFIANQKNLNQAGKLSKLLVVKSSDKGRFFIESKKIKLIYGFEEVQRGDSLHQRTSWLNHTICEIANKNSVSIGFSYSSLFNKNGHESSLLMGRMMQNIMLCRKYKVKTVIASFAETPFEMRSPYDVMSLFVNLGMRQEDINASMQIKF